MADNLTANPGSGGPTFATDDVSGVHYPVSKIAVGALDAVTLLSSGDGTTDAGTLRVTLGTNSPQTAFATSIAVAAGGTANLDSTQISSSKTGRLLQCRVSASVPWKAELQTMTNGVASSNKAVWFWIDPRALELPPGAITVAEDVTAGLDGFRVVVTNLDVTQTADLYAFFVWDEV